MYKTFILIIFTLVIVADFIIEVAKKKISPLDLILRGFVVLSFPFLVQWF